MTLLSSEVGTAAALPPVVWPEVDSRFVSSNEERRGGVRLQSEFNREFGR